MTRADDYGIYQAYLNGVKIGGPLDLYATDVSPWEWHLLGLLARAGRVHAAAGMRRQEPPITGYYLGLESVRLRARRPRVKEWARDKDNDWQKNPILYD